MFDTVRNQNMLLMCAYLIIAFFGEIFMNKKNIPSRLRWSCRRGMLELDVLLGNFLEEAYLGLTDNEQEIFVRLLESNDQDLFMWLTGKETPNLPEFIMMIEKIRQHAKYRHTS